MITYEKLSKNLVIYRRYLGVNAKTLGEGIGVTRQTINSIEAGRYKMTLTQFKALLFDLQNNYGELGQNVFNDNVTDEEMEFVRRITQRV